MAAHFTYAQILAVTRGALIQPGRTDQFAGVATDSRTIQAGELFIPLKGERHDGHEFIPKALERGARGVLIEEGFVVAGLKPATTPLPPEITVIAVPDTLTALGDLAAAWRARFRIPVVAVTGSCGKTTTKEMLALVLSRTYRVLKNPLNLNNLIGLPQTLLELDGVHEAAVVEMGMNRFGEIARLTQICRPTIGVLTNVHPAHTEGVGCVEGVARAKGELKENLAADATLIYNADDVRLEALARDFKGAALGFGFGRRAELQAHDRRLLGDLGQTAQVHFQGRSWPLTLKVAGLHQLYNALAAWAVGLSLHLPPEDIAAALAEFAPVVGRSQVLPLPGGANLLNDVYNANPGSMAMALHTLAELKNQGRAAAALGDMLELGQGAAQAHWDLGRAAAQAGVELLVIYGNHRLDVAAGAREEGLSEACIRPVESHAEGARALKAFLQPGDWLLVKGSRSTRMERLVAALAG